MSTFKLVLTIAALLLPFGSVRGNFTSSYVGVDLFVLKSATPGSIGSSTGGTAIAGGQVVGSSGFGEHAWLWTAPSGEPINLHPVKFSQLSYSTAAGTDGMQQVGYAYVPAQHAMLWNGTAESAIDLHPAHLGFSGSYANGVSHGQQVGVGVASDGSLRALVWEGTPASAVNLQPSHLTDVQWTVATASDGNQQVGFMNRYVNPTTLQGHAALWHGRADTAVDLHPVQLGTFFGTSANGVGGGQQVGFGILNAGGFHALVWSGTAESVVDLHPTGLAGITESTAMGTDGIRQVGFGNDYSQSTFQALLWTGTADSAVSLHAQLPPGFKSSFAYSLVNGEVYGTAIDLMDRVHAVKWTPIPEPNTVCLLAAALLVLPCTFRRR